MIENDKRNETNREIRSFLKFSEKLQEKCQMDISGGSQLVEFIYGSVEIPY
jgi:hypothetical protein